MSALGVAVGAPFIAVIGALGAASFAPAQLQAMHTRASSAWLLDPALGSNFALASQDFTDAAWATNGGVTSGLVITKNAAAAPDGTLTATLVMEDVTTNLHRLGHQLASTNGFNRRFSVYVKAAGRTKVRGWSFSFGDVSQQDFDLVTGVCGGTLSPKMTSVGNGWWRIEFDAPAADLNTVTFGPTDGVVGVGTASYPGDPTKGILAWGGQIEMTPAVGTPAGSYRPTTTAPVTRLTQYANNVLRIGTAPDGAQGALREPSSTNLQLQSGTIGTAPWSPTSVTVTANASIAPDGTATATNVANTVSVNSFISGSTGILANNATYTRTVYAKAISGNGLMALEANDGVTGSGTVFDLINGVISIPGTIGTASMEYVRDGWYRCRLTITTQATGTPVLQVHYVGAYGNTPTATTIALWGSQLEANAFPTSYIPTTAATVFRNEDVINDLVTVAAGAPFSMYFDFCQPPYFGGQVSTSRLSGTLAAGIGIAASGQAQVYNGTVLGVANNVLLAARSRVSYAGDGTGRSLCANGGVVVTDALSAGAITGIMPIGNQNAGGGTNAGVLWIHEYRRAFRRWGNSTLKLLTKLNDQVLGGSLAGLQAFHTRASPAWVQRSQYVSENLLRYSADVAGPNWIRRGTGSAAPATLTDPFGGQAAFTLSGLNGVGSNDLFQTGSGVLSPAGLAYLPSVYLSREGTSASGTLSINNTQNSANGRMDVDLSKLPPTGWTRVYPGHPAVTLIQFFTFTTGGAGMHFQGQTGGPLSVNVCAPQIEALRTSPGTYLPTTTEVITNYAHSLTQYAANAMRLVPGGAPSGADGILVEDQVTNLLLGSGDLSTGWSVNASPAPIGRSANAGASPDGGNNAVLLTRNTANTCYIVSGRADALGSYTASIYAKAGTAGGRLGMRIQASYPTRTDALFDLATGVVTASSLSGMTNAAARMSYVGGGWWRCEVSTTSPNALDSILITPCGTDQVLGGIEGTVGSLPANCYVWGAQLEVSGFASSYIPTAGATVTRFADAIAYDAFAVASGGIGGGVQYDQGTIYGSFEAPQLASGAVVNRAQFYSKLDAGNPRFSLRAYDTDLLPHFVVGDTASVATLTTAAPAAAKVKLAGSFDRSGVRQGTNGQTFSSAKVLATGAMVAAAGTAGNIGQSAVGLSINSWLTAIGFSKTALPVETLADVTT